MKFDYPGRALLCVVLWLGPALFVVLVIVVTYQPPPHLRRKPISWVSGRSSRARYRPPDHRARRPARAQQRGAPRRPQRLPHRFPALRAPQCPRARHDLDIAHSRREPPAGSLARPARAISLIPGCLVKNGEVRVDERESLARIVEGTQDCPTCHEIYALFWNAQEHVMNVAIQASELGQDRGVFLTDPKDFLGKVRFMAERIAERTGGYYVDSVWIPWLREQAHETPDTQEAGSGGA